MSAPEKYCSFSVPSASTNASLSSLNNNNVNVTNDDKERHSSGDSQDSALSSSPPMNDENVDNKNVDKNVEKTKNGVDIFVDSANKTPKSTESLTSVDNPARGILKTSNPNRGRCFSESTLMTSPPSLSSCISVDSSIPEEPEDDSAFANENGKS